MSEFDKIIGYDAIKEELKQLCDMIHNMSIYEKLGAKMSKGLLIYGVPGVGKSLMARSFITECGRRSYTIRRSKPDGDFINEIKNIFTEAKENAPAVILLDDMDKFAVDEHNKEEFVAIQACIDEVSFSDVYVIATVNDLHEIPRSLLRAGRFDRKIHVEPPEGEEAKKIIQHYLKSKSVEENINIDDITTMFSGRSCAELETILNEAAILAGYNRCDKISINHIVQYVLRDIFGVSISHIPVNTDTLMQTAFHEAGHILALELFHPGTVGLASILKSGNSKFNGIVVNRVSNIKSDHRIIIKLAGKIATELKYGIVCEGSSDDLTRAIDIISDNITEEAFCGTGGLDIKTSFRTSPSDTKKAMQEHIIQAELERYMALTREILVKNKSFLSTVAEALLEKDALLNSDIRKIRESCSKLIA